MPQPTPGDLHVSRPLTNISVAYQQAATMFIADQVFPNVPVQHKTDSYYEYTKKGWFATEAKERPPNTESAGSGYELTTKEYTATRYAVHKDVDIELRANADSPIAPDREATQFVTNQLLLKRDQLWVSTFMAASVWTTDFTGVNSGPTGNQFLRWNEAGSVPIKDIKDGVVRVAKRTGRRPQILVLNPEVFVVLTEHADILDRIKYTQRGVVTEEILAGLFGVDRVLVAWAIEDTSTNEVDAEIMNFMIGKDALLVYAAPSPGLMTPTGGYIFPWRGLLGGSAFGSRIRRFEMDELTSTRIEGEMAFDMKVVGADLAQYFVTAIA